MSVVDSELCQVNLIGSKDWCVVQQIQNISLSMHDRRR
jgi:hypothetical protein